jgi:hypothetical protein
MGVLLTASMIDFLYTVSETTPFLQREIPELSKISEHMRCPDSSMTYATL